MPDQFLYERLDVASSMGFLKEEVAVMPLNSTKGYETPEE